MSADEELRPRHFYIKSSDTTGFSRVVFQFLATTTRAIPLDTTGFSRVVFQFLPTTTRAIPLDATGFSRVAEAGGVSASRQTSAMAVSSPQAACAADNKACR